MTRDVCRGEGGGGQGDTRTWRHHNKHGGDTHINLVMAICKKDPTTCDEELGVLTEA